MSPDSAGDARTDRADGVLAGSADVISVVTAQQRAKLAVVRELRASAVVPIEVVGGR